MREIRFRTWGAEGFTYIDLRFLNSLSTVNVEWQQYTGLRDKYGVRIYEGDIIENNKDPMSVIYLDGAFRISYLNMILCESLISDYHLKVIGNIYENPELLGEKHDQDQ